MELLEYLSKNKIQFTDGNCIISEELIKNCFDFYKKTGKKFILKKILQELNRIEYLPITIQEYPGMDYTILIKDILENIDFLHIQNLITTEQKIKLLEKVDYIKYVNTVRKSLCKSKIIKPRKEGKTYLMKDSKNFVKIGFSIYPKIREGTLQSENPSIKLIAICDKNIEKELHEIYKDKNIRGEWFNLTDLEINIIIDTFNFKRHHGKRTRF